MISIDPNSVQGKSINRGRVARDARALTVPLNFAASASFSLTVNAASHIRNVAGIDGVQSVFVDNSANASALTIVFDFNQTLVVPANAQGVYPIFWPGEQLTFTASATIGAGISNLIFTNTKEFAALWSTKIPISGSVNVTGSQVYTQPAFGLFTDASGVLAAGGVSQLLVAANGARQLLSVRNPASAASQGIAAPEPVFINFGVAAATNGATSWELLPGEQLPRFELTTTQAIYWTAATVGHSLICKVM